MWGIPQLTDDILIIVLGVIAALLAGIIVFVIVRLVTVKRVDHEMKLLIAAKKYEAAAALGEEYLKRHKPEFAVLIALGEAYDMMQDWTKALKYYSDASITAGKNKAVYHSVVVRLARVCERLGRHKDALSYYLMILEADGSNAEVLYEIAVHHYDTRNLKKAREYIEQLLKFRPGLIDARFLYGKTLFETGQFASALKQFELLEKYDPENREVFFLKGRCLENLKMFNDAVNALETYLSFEDLIAEQRERAMTSMLQMLLKSKQHRTGVEKAEKFLGGELTDGTKKEIMYLCANLKKELGEEYKSVLMFNEIARIDPGFRDAGMIAKKYEKLVQHSILSKYFTSDEEMFDKVCRNILTNPSYQLVHRGLDQYIYLRGGNYAVFFRHIDPINYAQMSALETLIGARREAFGGCEIYALYGTDNDTSVHPWRKTSDVIERDELLKKLKKAAETLS
ncbi:MAG: hypothetical protein A2Y33_05845 [Spirochaetes bacterium GWF1_51_8]|nr:MAG: hypothetical protein A2Y33_05845 [Spirochaetes bacterium GWF1_51_8]